MTTVQNVVLPRGAIVGNHGGSQVVGVHGILPRSAEVTNCLKWSRPMELRWTDSHGQLQIKKFTLPAFGEATLNKLIPGTNYTLIVKMPVIGGALLDKSPVEQTRVSFRTPLEQPIDRTVGSLGAPSFGSKQQVFASKQAAISSFMDIINARGKRYHLDLVAQGKYDGGVVCVHDYNYSLPYGVDDHGRPYVLSLSLRMMPKEHVKNGNRIKVIVFGYSDSPDRSQTLFFGTIVEINGRTVAIKDSILNR